MEELFKSIYGEQEEEDVTLTSDHASIPPGFSWADYFDKLTTTSIGRCPAWADILPSSYTLCQSVLSRLPKQSGLCLVSSVQTAGVGKASG